MSREVGTIAPRAVVCFDCGAVISQGQECVRRGGEYRHLLCPEPIPIGRVLRAVWPHIVLCIPLALVVVAVIAFAVACLIFGGERVTAVTDPIAMAILTWLHQLARCGLVGC